jgi:hypothetical protein
VTPFVVPASGSFIDPRLLVKEFLLCSFRCMLAYHWSLATTKHGMHWLVSPLLLSSHLQEGWILFSPLRRAGISQQKSPEGCAERPEAGTSYYKQSSSFWVSIDNYS